MMKDAYEEEAAAKERTVSLALKHRDYSSITLLLSLYSRLCAWK